MVDVYSVVDQLGCYMNAMLNTVRRREEDASCSGVLTACGLEMFGPYCLWANATPALVDVRSLYTEEDTGDDLAIAEIDVLYQAAGWNRLEQVWLVSVGHMSTDS